MSEDVRVVRGEVLERVALLERARQRHADWRDVTADLSRAAVLARALWVADEALEGRVHLGTYVATVPVEQREGQAVRVLQWALDGTKGTGV